MWLSIKRQSQITGALYIDIEIEDCLLEAMLGDEKVENIKKL